MNVFYNDDHDDGDGDDDCNDWKDDNDENNDDDDEEGPITLHNDRAANSNLNSTDTNMAQKMNTKFIILFFN